MHTTERNCVAILHAALGNCLIYYYVVAVHTCLLSNPVFLSLFLPFLLYFLIHFLLPTPLIVTHPS